MNSKRLIALICSFVLASACCALAQGTAFTYQGQLEDDGSPANGFYDITVSVWDAVAGPAQVGPTLTNTAVEVVNGLFTVTLDFGSGVFTGPDRWLEIGVQTNGGGGFSTLSPRTEVTAAPYAIFAGTVSTVPLNSVGSPEVINNSLTASDLAANSVGASEIATGAVGTSEVANGSLTLADLNLASVDGRYVLKAGDTMTGNLTTPNLTVNGTVGIGTASPSDSLHVFDAGNEGDIMVENSYPFITFNKTTAGANSGIQFSDNGAYDGWLYLRGTDDAMVLASTASGTAPNQLVLQRDQNVGIGTAAAFTDLTLDGSIGFKSSTTPGMFIYESGTLNADKPVIVHSPSYTGWGLFYKDDGDRFYISSNGSADPALMVSVGGDWVTINTDTPKPGYELSVDGQIVCEELLVENSVDWPDYVFAENYPLRSLDEVEAHIKENKHLPGIPTAEDVKRDGLLIGEMQKRLMEKIEELTLYVIDQNKRLASQDERIRQLESELNATEVR